jgi:hypothetical protein
MDKAIGRMCLLLGIEQRDAAIGREMKDSLQSRNPADFWSLETVDVSA